MYSVLAFLIVFGVIVFAHELGHFICARRSGMGVEEFGFGFPPRLFGLKRGNTVYSINLIPLGGFVKIKGENGENADDDDSFASKGIWKRAATLGAGVFANLILAYVIFTAGYAIGAPQATDNLPADAIVTDAKVFVAEVLAGSPADAAGVKSEDVIRKVNGAVPADAEGLRALIKNSSGNIVLSLERGGSEKDVTVSPAVLKETGSRGIGVSLASAGTVRFPWYRAPVYAAEAVASIVGAIFAALWNLVLGLFAGNGAPVDVTGPIGIAAATSAAARLGWSYLAEFTAILSLNLAVLNIIPFPALDGGRLLFLLVEALRRRPISRKIEGIVHESGFALLMLLVLVITWRDLVRYGGAITGFFKGMF
jgi:regulator of sigma E protease